MKHLIVILFVISSGKISSQNLFYLTPSVNTKLNISSTNWTHFSSLFPSNDYFDIYNNTLHFSTYLGLGLEFEWENKQNNFAIGLSWNQDIASVSAREVYLSANGLDDWNNYFSQELKTRKSIETHRFSLNVSKPFFGDYAAIKIGTGVLFSPSGHKVGKDLYYNTFSFEPFHLEENLIIGRSYSVLANKRLSFNLSLGISKKIKWKESYLFSLDIIYSQGFRNITAGSFYYTITDLESDNEKRLDYGLYSRGSGFIFQLSRKINFNKPNKESS
jgi:hypothetical protein